MFWSKNKKNRYTPAYPIFTMGYAGFMGFKGVFFARTCFPDVLSTPSHGVLHVSVVFFETINQNYALE